MDKSRSSTHQAFAAFACSISLAAEAKGIQSFRTRTIRAQAQTFRMQPSGRFVLNKLWLKMFKTKMNIYCIYPSNRKKTNF